MLNAIKVNLSRQEIIGKTLLCFKDNPLQYAEWLTDPELGGYRFRIGYYRVIFDIEGNGMSCLAPVTAKKIDIYN